MKIVVDTSVWIDYFRANPTPQALLFKQYLNEDRLIYLLPVIVQEVLQGIYHDKVFQQILDLLRAFPLLPSDPLGDAIDAAILYRKLRKKGITIKKSNDILIAALCQKHQAMILHRDRDFGLISGHCALHVIPVPEN